MRAARVVLRKWPAEVRLEAEVVQTANAAHYTSQGGGKQRVGRIGVVHLPVDEVAVDGGSEGSPSLPGGAVERDPGAAAGRAADGETLRLGPGADPLKVAGAEAETLGELFGGEPLMVIRRGR